jgi:hypothetical protein
MCQLAKHLEDVGWTLRSGNAKGVDQAFASCVIKNTQIWLLWSKFEKSFMNSKLYWLYSKSPTELEELGALHIVQCDDYLVQCEMTEEQAQSLIPKNTIYCYDQNRLCPFWDRIKQFPSQSNGHCHYLKTGDHDLKSFGMLWDQCKCCGISDDLGEN